jgi:hypothetical protein
MQLPSNHPPAESGNVTGYKNAPAPEQLTASAALDDEVVFVGLGVQELSELGFFRYRKKLRQVAPKKVQARLPVGLSVNAQAQIDSSIHKLSLAALCYL